MKITAQLNYLHISPRKVRLTVNLIKGMPVDQAKLQLKFLSKRSSGPVLKLLNSALANAKNNFKLDENGLYVSSIKVNEGPMFKRFRPRAFGKAAMLRKRTSHVSLVLETKENIVKPETKKSKPEIREADTRDLKEGEHLELKSKESSQEKDMSKPKSKKGFTRKIFQRKAI